MWIQTSETTDCIMRRSNLDCPITSDETPEQSADSRTPLCSLGSGSGCNQTTSLAFCRRKLETRSPKSRNIPRNLAERTNVRACSAQKKKKKNDEKKGISSFGATLYRIKYTLISIMPKVSMAHLVINHGCLITWRMNLLIPRLASCTLF